MLNLNRIKDKKHGNDKIKFLISDGSYLDFEDFKNSNYSFREIKLVRYGNSKNLVKFPLEFSEDLVYLIGVIIGDGSVQTPIKRKKGGYYHRVSISGRLDFLENIILPIVVRLFGYKPKLQKKKGREFSWQLNMESVVLYRFFNRVIGVPFGKKNHKKVTPKSLNIPTIYLRHFLAGLIDTDGHVSNYINLTQKNKQFLDEIKTKSNHELNLNFRGPYVNRRISNKTVGWCIQIHKKAHIKEFINKVPLRYKMGS